MPRRKADTGKEVHLLLAVLRAALNYDVATGLFTWRMGGKGRRGGVGAVAGTLDAKGYRIIHIAYRKYLAHRLAWFYMYGVWPADDLDHINHDTADNSITNLREASPAENQQNRVRAMANSSHGFLGVHYNDKQRRYHARIQTGKKRIFLGSFKSAEAAYAAYLAAKQQLHITTTLGDNNAKT